MTEDEKEKMKKDEKDWYAKGRDAAEVERDAAEVETLADAYVYYVEARHTALVARYAADDAAHQERRAAELLDAARTAFLAANAPDTDERM